jgi:hypothetical protein
MSPSPNAELKTTDILGAFAILATLAGFACYAIGSMGPLAAWMVSAFMSSVPMGL